ncbi:MAG: ATP-binding protein [Anaerolineae bacterium]|nr:DeoR family transcriptional regulator [Thermoflexales bacterium]MDW8406803.1 ATP-binding protein [Anaerolineae bacterium]
MITLVDLKKLLSAGPGQRIEVLSPAVATPERIARSLASLANSKGGVLIVDLNAPSGRHTVDVNAGDIRDRAMQALLMTEPHLIVPLPYLLPAEPEGLPQALIVEVPDGLPHVYSLEGRYLGRNGARIVPLPARTLRELMLIRSDDAREWEAKSPAGSGKDDLDWARAESYAAAHSLKEPTVEDVLLRRGCIVMAGRRVRPTYAGLLLFGRQPQRWVRGAEIMAVRFNGASMDDVFIRQTIDGVLPDQIRRAELFIAENLSRRARIGNWRRSEETLYPPGVLREAVVNAVAHRDYRLIGNQIHLLIFSDRVEVRSPGKLPGHVTLKNLLHERYSRNEAIVQVLADMGFIERLGYGIDRMVRSMKEAGHDAPQFEETDGGFAVTLRAKPAAVAQIPGDIATDRAGALPQTPQQQRLDKMIEYLRAHGRITNREYQELCPDVSAESLRRDFVELVEAGIILRVGDKKGTYYILK